MAAHSSSSLLAYAIAALVSYVLCTIGYRLLLHPLRRYPGPFIARLTDFYGVYYAYGCRLHLKTWENFTNYGPVVRQGPNKLVFSSVQALKDIYQNEMVTKSQVYRATMWTSTSFFAFNSIDKNMHRAKRRVVVQSLSDRAMRDFEPIMTREIQVFLRLLLEPGPIDLSRRCKCLALDIAALLAYGHPFDLQTQEKNRFLLDSLQSRDFRVNLYLQLRAVTTLGLQTIVEIPFFRTQKRWLSLIRPMILTRISQERREKVDLYSFAYDSVSESARKSNELWAEAFFFLLAGGDTVATAECATLFYLSRYPECYEALALEIRSTFTSGEEIRGGAKLASCRYLRACIDEALRMSPPVSGTLWRTQTSEKPSNPLVVDGHVIPPGTEVGVNMYIIHHNKDYFPDPFTYKPERWLDDSIPEDQKKLMHDAFSPFSVGSRSCAGKAMAYLEAGLVLAKTLWYFDFKRAPGKLGDVGGGKDGERGRERRNEFQLYDHFASAHEGPCLVFQPREGLWQDLASDKPMAGEESKAKEQK